MNHVVGMGIRNRLTDDLEDGEKPAAVGREIGAVFKAICKRASFDQFHRQVRAAVGHCADLMNGRNAGMLQLTGNACFVRESLRDGQTGMKAVTQNLDRHLAPDDVIARAVNDSHAAATDFGQQGETRWTFR